MECGVCSRVFANGKALGGHMRSHFAALPLPPKTPQRQELSEPLTDSTSSILSSGSSGDKSSLISGSYGLREKPKKSLRLADLDSVVDRQSETGSTRARCKRGKGIMEDDQEVTKRGVVVQKELEMEMEEDVALCLVMLSRDAWRASASPPEEMREKIYECDKCDRVFKSTQGLGSHRSNHHEKKPKKSSDDVICDKELRKVENHECRFCGKVFKSGKALGGHKRVHLLPSKLVGTPTSLVEDRSPIDLNLPPEIEDEEFDSC